MERSRDAVGKKKGSKGVSRNEGCFLKGASSIFQAESI